MRILKFIRQPHVANGCGVACIAILTGSTYDEIKSILLSEMPRLKYDLSPGMGLQHYELRDILKNIFNIKCSIIDFVSLSRLKKHCLLAICSRRGRECNGHGVVFDAKKRCLLDPAKSIKDLKGRKVVCCVEIQ